MLNLKLIISKILILLIFTLTMSSNVFGFDLKKLQEGLNQLKEQQNSGDNSNPLGNLMKNMQGVAKGISGNAGTGKNNFGKINNQTSSKSSSGIRDVKKICGFGLRFYKDLPAPNIANLEKDFGKKSNAIEEVINGTPSIGNDKIVSSLENFKGAFESNQIEDIFNKFLLNKDLNSLSILRETAQISPGFNKGKKQIKADAMFAYGLIHYVYGNSGASKNLGIQYIKEASGTPDNIGALTTYGAWQFYGINIPQNIQNGNKMALDGYNRAYDKKLVLGNPNSPLFNKAPFNHAETVFLAIANDTRNPFRNQYQNQLAQAKQMQKEMEKEIAKQSYYSPKSFYTNEIKKQANAQHELLKELSTLAGVAEELSKLKQQYVLLESKVKGNPAVLNEMIGINDKMAKRILEVLRSKKESDEKGKTKIVNLKHDNQIMILRNDELVTVIMFSMLSGASSSNLFDSKLHNDLNVVGRFAKIACKVDNGITNYASNSNVNIGKPVTSSKTKMRTIKSFGKNRG